MLQTCFCDFRNMYQRRTECTTLDRCCLQEVILKTCLKSMRDKSNRLYVKHVLTRLGRIRIVTMTIEERAIDPSLKFCCLRKEAELLFTGLFCSRNFEHHRKIYFLLNGIPRSLNMTLRSITRIRVVVYSKMKTTESSCLWAFLWSLKTLWVRNLLCIGDGVVYMYIHCKNIGLLRIGCTCKMVVMLARAIKIWEQELKNV